MDREEILFCLKMIFITSMPIILVIVFKLYMVLWWRPRKIEDHFSKQGIRGPPYKILLGNYKELATMSIEATSQPMPLSHNILPRVLAFYHQWKKVYGAPFLAWFGSTARLAVSDPDLVKEIFTSKSEYFEKVEALAPVRLLEGEGLLNLKGEKWAHHKRILTPAFHLKNLNIFVPALARSVMDMLDKWSKMSNNGEVEIDVSKWFSTLLEDVLARTAFGSNYEDDKAIFELQEQQMLLAAEAFQNVSIPGFRFLPTKRNMNSWKWGRDIEKSVMKVIERRKDDSANQMSDKTPKDVLGLLIQASRSSPLNITVHDIVEECKTFFFAGKHTTSNLLTWTTVLLAMHPEWQEQARDEVFKECGSRELPNKDNLAKLKMLNMIINESSRLYPPAVAMLRKAKCDVELGPYNIPAGTEVMIATLDIHHDKAIWGNDANEFNPSRFAMGVARASQHPFGFIPFGFGVRKCIGQNLAVLKAKLALAIILQNFSFRLSPRYQHAPTVLMLLYPQYGAPIIFQKLSDPAGSGD